ncbi:hypothetical protein BCR33DRAFT_713058 [Rhizoclosmatium globosum]|uniref:HIG1 domain-containing protein n=1 Tax=Rhizoclosmatium globosum TaxID=329046 RepID=A0A1Y2BH35_9FUNG|nr:hypothetical protein BCR33DRAFT_723101 [Rhizoclosmatium globosum]ORY50225.1 hypothetical protein BCR33DRAFT_713058 [Rhizoclosmatium globosum]|eukprot:ORY33890.1 hypothetical protein BCR33DRAFT_723101 [Rhizoclosmatium globosum]
MGEAVASFSQALDRCSSHALIVGGSAAFWGFTFTFLRVRQRYPDLMKRNKTVAPVLLGISTIVGYSLYKYSHSSCLQRYAAKFPDEAKAWELSKKKEAEEEAKRKAAESQ